jgi:transposase
MRGEKEQSIDSFCCNDQMFLLPPSLIEWLPKNHLVFFVRDILEKIDLSPITSVYEQEERGFPPYHPKVMTGAHNRWPHRAG